MTGSLNAILEFNFFPARYVHRGWLAELPYTPLFKELERFRQTEKARSRYLLARFGIFNDYFFHFESRASQIGLLSRAELLRLLELTGLLMNQGYISTLIDGAALRSIQQQVGAADFEIMQRGARISYPTMQASPRRVERFRAHALACGLRGLRTAYRVYPKGFTQRLALKLGPAMTEMLHTLEGFEDEPSARRLLLEAYDHLLTEQQIRSETAAGSVSPAAKES